MIKMTKNNKNYETKNVGYMIAKEHKKNVSLRPKVCNVIFLYAEKTKNLAFSWGFARGA
jgi:hypothetical protein